MDSKPSEMPISIFPLFLLLLGVASSYPKGLHDDEEVFQPMVSRSNERRICVELCMSGLGGEPCGDDCVDLSPLSIPIQYQPDGQTVENATDIPEKQVHSAVVRATPRNASCPVLCANNLGYPLCNCQQYDDHNANHRIGGYRVDFAQICGQFCIEYDYRIFGCQKCDVYRKLSKETEEDSNNQGRLTMMRNGKFRRFVPTTQMVLSLTLSPAWTQWCVNKCAEGEGGSACNCDKPIMATLG